MMYPISMCRGTILCCLIVVQVVQLSVASGSSLNVEQFQSGSDPGSSSLSLFPGPGGDSGLTGGNLGLSSSSDGLMVPFNNGGDFELAIGDKNCAPGPKRRGKRRARRDDQTFCPSNFQLNNPPNRPQKAGQQSGGSQRQTTPPKLQQDPPKIPGSDDPDPDMPPILLEQLDVPQPDPSICPWGIVGIPICAKPEDSDDSKDILPGMGFISDFVDILHWNRYDPATGCQHGEALYCCHFVKPQPILEHPQEDNVLEVDLSSPLPPFDGWFNQDPPPSDPEAARRERVRDYTATLCRPGPTPDYPGPQRNNYQPNH